MSNVAVFFEQLAATNASTAVKPIESNFVFIRNWDWIDRVLIQLCVSSLVDLLGATQPQWFSSFNPIFMHDNLDPAEAE